MPVRPWVKIAADAEVHAGDMLVHVGDGTARPERESQTAEAPFALVLDPKPGERAPDGSYRVKCELMGTSVFAATVTTVEKH